MLNSTAHNIQRHTKDTQDTEGNDDLFSIPSNAGERPLSVLAWQCTGASTELLSTALCVSKGLRACLWGKTEAGDSLKRWRVVAVFPVGLILSEGDALNSLGSTLDNKAWMIQCWGSALFQLLPQLAKSSYNHFLTWAQTERLIRKADMKRMNLKEKLKMHGVKKTAQNEQKKKRISFDFGQNLIRSVSHWNGIKTTFHWLPLAKIPSLNFPKQKLNDFLLHFVEPTNHMYGAKLSLCCKHTHTHTSEGSLRDPI